MAMEYYDENLVVALAAEEFPDDQFDKYHTFSDYENRIIRKLIAHGPVLLRGGRGSGKSALLKESYYRINKEPISNKAIGIYLSLRHLSLLRNEGKEYESFFCSLLIDHVNNFIQDKLKKHDLIFDPEPEVGKIQKELTKLAIKLERRIVLFFDDAAHIGREVSLKEFFDIFRTLSSNAISCKAAIYPGVTEFGARFDLLNDANVIDISRNEELPYFSTFFSDIIKKRYPNDLPVNVFPKNLPLEEVAIFLGRAVIGNVRAFIRACNFLTQIRGNSQVSLLFLEKTLKNLASEYYWPLLEELEPKLGCYEPLVTPARELAEILVTTHLL
ncbi:MAG: ATP-binding protein, partial [Halanaerobiales bacterium]|nr:ATP-binding protein [Halanaerobiales bacterium]